MSSQPNEKSYERTTITVPVSLKNRMKTLGRNVNWSSVACAAFEHKIEKVQEAERKHLEHAITRLRKESSKTTICSDFEKGFSAGRQWAIENASIDALDRLQQMRSSVSREDWGSFFQDEQRIDELTAVIDGLKDNRDDKYDDAVCLTIEHGKGSVSMLQRELGIGYGRAARLIDLMEKDGVVGPYAGAKPRPVIVDAESWPMVKVWNSVLGRKPPTSQKFYEGFVDGAIDVWTAVREAI